MILAGLTLLPGCGGEGSPDDTTDTGSKEETVSDETDEDDKTGGEDTATADTDSESDDTDMAADGDTAKFIPLENHCLQLKN